MAEEVRFLKKIEEVLLMADQFRGSGIITALRFELDKVFGDLIS